MSSSDRLKRPNLVHLGRETPPVRKTAFRSQASFERIESARGALVDPDEAFKNGVIEGEQRGRAAALKELEPVLEEFRALTRALSLARAERIAQAERELTQIASEIASRILHGELSQGGDVAVRMARACIAEAQELEGTLTLHVSAGDLDLIRTHLPELQVDLVDCPIQIAADPSLDAGEVVLETARRCYDGRPGRLVEQIKRGMP